MKKVLIQIFLLNLSLALLTSCERYVDVEPPRTDLVRSTVFESDATAEAAVIDVYYTMKTSGFASGDGSSISFYAALVSDETVFYGTGLNAATAYQQFFDNRLKPSNPLIASLWSDIYKVIYKTNAVIEGLQNSDQVSEDTRNRLIGESKFLRSFCYFYLVNLWGDVPEVLTTDYIVNGTQGRTPKQEIYDHIISDLLQAKDLAPDDFSKYNGERVRATGLTASALLSRVYLYLQKWEDAEKEATVVINSPYFSLVNDLTKVMMKNSTEAIWQLWSNYYPNDLFTFYLLSTPPRYGTLRNDFPETFESDDLRKNAWIGSAGEAPYYFSKKYQSFTAAAEFSTVLRLSEQFLIRSEARAKLGDIEGANSDLNAVRNRAGLADKSYQDVAMLSKAIENERRIEFFNEWGHRWFDMKRYNRTTQILSDLKPFWNVEDELFPIPEIQITNNPKTTQNFNPGE